MSDNCDIKHPLKREGTYQWQRLQEGLKKGFYKPDDRSVEQMVMQVAQFASDVRYYDINLNVLGNWEAFFDYLYDYSTKKLKIDNVDSLLASGMVPAHIGLLLSFLKTFESTREELNNFTTKHVNFYYRDVLQLSPANAVADKVAIIFEPEKATLQALVPTGTELNAGKDATQKDLVYKTTREIVVNQVGIAQKKTIWADKDATGKVGGLYMAKDAAAENKFTRNNVTSWYPFGSVNNKPAEIGFAISSPMLLARDGRRRFSIEIDGAEQLPRGALLAYYTGAKGWVEAEVDTQPGSYNSGIAQARRFLLIKIDEALPAVVVYDEKVHKSGLSCEYPVLKVLLKNDATFPNSYLFLSALKLSSVKKLVMNVEGSQSFTITGENGVLNPLQAFRPFGSNPVKNKSFFIIGSTEAFNKYSSTFHLAMNWKGLAGNLFNYYRAYDKFMLAKGLQNKIATKRVWVPNGTAVTLINDAYSAFRAPFIGFNQGNVPGKVAMLSGGKWAAAAEDTPNHYQSRTRSGSYNTFHVNGKVRDEFDLTNSDEFDASSRWGFVRVTLGYDFGHAYHAAVLADVVLQNTKAAANALEPLPNVPYTPEFNSLHLDYVLEDSFDTSKLSEHQFIQLHPFGYDKITSVEKPLVSPDYNHNGQLYIGLSNFSVSQIVNLYFARLDGSEDIDALINENVEMFYLAGADWVKFKFEEIVLDTTHGFTSSGFLSLSLPEAALAPNTVLGENLAWVKIASPTSALAYPSIIDIHNNAVEAAFDDRSNDKFHLQVPLKPGTITKPLIKIDGVKAASQPYASYGGQIEEQEDHFNIRVSERLRHKARGWSIWDYEHLVLNRFPEVYKIKCISHAVKDSMYAPGHVLCVVLPTTVNIPEKDLLQPRLSKALLTAAKEYVSQYITTFANAEFINPVYEIITIKCSVKIRKGFDTNFYAVQLNKDLQAFIAPWMADRSISPSFGGVLYASAIINFIEERAYVDYLTFFEATKMEDGKLIVWKEYTTGSREDVILTSAPQHEIDTNAIC